MAIIYVAIFLIVPNNFFSAKVFLSSDSYFLKIKTMSEEELHEIYTDIRVLKEYSGGWVEDIEETAYLLRLSTREVIKVVFDVHDDARNPDRSTRRELSRRTLTLDEGLPEVVLVKARALIEELESSKS